MKAGDLVIYSHTNEAVIILTEKPVYLDHLGNKTTWDFEILSCDCVYYADFDDLEVLIESR